MKGGPGMKGVARADGLPSADYEAVVLALSQLSNAVIADHSSGGALAAAAETGAVLLQLDASAIFLLNESSSSIEVAAMYQIDLPLKRTRLPAESIVKSCIESGSPVIVTNLATEKRKGLSALARQGMISLICVPLKVGERSMGAFVGMSNTLRAFSTSDIEVLSAVATQVGFAAWKLKLSGNILPDSDSPVISPTDVQLIELANRKIQELSIVNKISEAVISTLNLGELLNLALDQCLVAVGATVGSIMLLNEDSQRLSIKAAKGLKQEIVDTASTAVGEGIAGWVAEHGQPVLVHDARQDQRFHLFRYRDDITSAMSIPLKARGRVIGVLNASTIELGRRFGPREVEFLSTIANQVAMAIDNAQLYDRLNKRSVELASLLQISEAITATLEPREVLSLLAKKFMAMAHVDACALLSYEPDSGRFRCLEGRGLSIRNRKSAYLELSLPIAKHALNEGGPVCGDLASGLLFSNDIAISEGFSSAICVPLTAPDRIVGAIALFSSARRLFSTAELQMLASIGGLAGVALHNALVYKHKYNIARALQFQLVPTVPLKADGLDVGHKFLPAREVGGDYYDIISISPGRVGIVIADVAGNSVPAAMYTSMGKHVLRAYAIEDHSPAEVMSRLNRVACDETQAEVFISLFYGVFDASDRTFRYACAGHEPPLLYHPDGSFDRLQADGILVGIKPDIGFEEKCVQLKSGSIMVLFTDGLVDSPATRGKFTVEDVQNIIAKAKLKPAQELADNVYMRLMEVAGTGPQDDVALVVLKVM
jgi:GAF domain-containing protein